jgi:hypothetical protein
MLSDMIITIVKTVSVIIITELTKKYIKDLYKRKCNTAFKRWLGIHESDDVDDKDDVAVDDENDSDRLAFDDLTLSFNFNSCTFGLTSFSSFSSVGSLVSNTFLLNLFVWARCE